MKQLIFVVETNSSTQSDDRYIMKLINHRYDLSKNDIRISFVHMGGKGNYNKNKTLDLINKYKKNNSGESIIFYCFDTDSIGSNQVRKKEFSEEKRFCINKGFLLIWFNLNIEHVLLGKIINASEKKIESIKFWNNSNVLIPTKKLFCENSELEGYSNFYFLLDVHLQRINN